MRKNYLLTPGPTPLPPEVSLAQARPIIHHRTPQFQAELKEAFSGLKYIFQTERDVFMISSSGTGAMETAVVNLLSPRGHGAGSGGRKIRPEMERDLQGIRDLGGGDGSGVGKAADPKDVNAALKANPSIKAVFATLCETSTGVTFDIRGLGGGRP